MRLRPPLLLLLLLLLSVLDPTAGEGGVGEGDGEECGEVVGEPVGEGSAVMGAKGDPEANTTRPSVHLCTQNE